MKNFLNGLVNWYFSKRALPYWIILVVDMVSVAFAGYLAYYVQHGGGGFIHHFWPLTFGLCIAEIVFIILFRIFHTYSVTMRHIAYRDFLHVFLATFLGTILTYLMYRIQAFMGWGWVDLPGGFSGMVAFFFCILSIMIAVRILARWVYEGVVRQNAKQRVFVYGVKSGGISIAQGLEQENLHHFRVVGFVSPEGDLKSKYLMGVQVRRDGPNLVKHIKDAHATVLIVSPALSAHFRTRQGLIDELITNNIRIMMFPDATEWDGKSPLRESAMREVEIEDLLPRDEIQVNMDNIGAMLRGKCILITGAAGSIGNEMVRQIAPYQPSKMVLIDQAETPMHDVRRWCQQHGDNGTHFETIVTSITNSSHMERIFAAFKPEYVFHAAAYKHVPMMEDNPAIAVQNNIYGTRVIADLAVKYGTKKFVMISTDKAVNPTNVMGCSKRICEIYCQSLNKSILDGTCTIPTAQGGKPVTQFVTTRFGNVLGSNGSVIPIFREQIRRGGPITVTHPDINRYFMLIPEACKLVLEAGTMGNGGEIFVFDMGESVKIVDLAKRMIRLSGAQNIEIKFTGLRDGEKIQEEVLNDSEKNLPTHHDKIQKARVREYPYTEALKNEERLLQASYSFDDMAIVKIMKEIVPEYKSHSSKYEVLD